ncbi:MAG TPA: DHA2 family efflux MFS transporter permease subunit [Fimbriimonadaceae bacterium]|jgi:DHA2 family multidrug resistance protein
MIAISVAIAALLEVIDTSIVNVALTDMQASLGATLSEVGWVVTSYGIANVIMIPLSAWLGDTFGKKRYFVFAMAGFTLASVMCGLAPNLQTLIIARIIQGLMGGGLLAKAQAFLFENFPIEEQGTVQAIFGVCVIAGPAIGPTLGGWLTTNYSWPWIFFINLPVGIAATLMCITFLPKDPERKKVRDVDWAGIGLLIVWVGSLQTLLEQGNEDDWFDSSFIRVLAASAAFGLVLWIWRELRAKKPAVNLQVLRHRSLSGGSAYSFVLGAGLYGALFAVPIFAQQVLGYTAYQTGMLLLPGALASAVMMVIMGRLMGRVDARILIFSGSLVLITSMVMLSKISINTGPSDIFWPMIVRGIGTTMMFLPLSIAAFGPLPKSDVSAASGFYNLTRQFGGSVGIAVLTTLLARREAFHRSVLVANVTSYSPEVQQRLSGLTHFFISKGASVSGAGKQALAALDGTVNQQAAVLSFGDTFYLVSLAFLFALPLLFLLGSGKGGKPAGDVH